MARPNKKGLDYFPFNVDFFDDDKIAFVSARFQEKGELIAIKLLCKIYKDNGYYYNWGEDEAVLFSKRVVGDASQHTSVKDVVHELIKRGLFDKDIFDRFKILTSKGVQARYLQAIAGRKEIEIIIEYWLIEFPKSAQKIIKRSINEVYRSINEVNRQESTQRIEKERIEKERRGEKREIFTPFDEFLNSNKIYNSENSEFLSSEMWFETKAMQLSSQPEILIEKAKDFLVDLNHRDQIEGKNLADLRSHFVSWFKLKRSQEPENKKVDYRIPKYNVL